MKEKNCSAKGKVKIRGAKELAEDLSESSSKKASKTPNPIKKQIKLDQFPWTDKQKEFFKVALIVLTCLFVDR